MSGPTRYRVEWLPGSDQLVGTCHCGAQRTADDPAELWHWLLGHPLDHRAAVGRAAEPQPAGVGA